MNLSDYPTPKTDAFASRLSAAKVPVSRTWPHWYDHAAYLERKLARCRDALAASASRMARFGLDNGEAAAALEETE